jgi:hypothetical protein
MVHPVERLVEVFTTGETSGSVLKNEVVKVLEDIHFDMAWVIGQCYDGAGNMRGRYAGLATLIQKECKKAVYIWCNAYRLNLVMNGVMKCCAEIKNTLGLLEELHTFMNGHRRHAVFQSCQDQFRYRMQLKRGLTTRWNSTESAVETVIARYAEILETLLQLADSSSNDSDTVTLASGLRKRLRDFRVILSMETLGMIYPSIQNSTRSFD